MPLVFKVAFLPESEFSPPILNLRNAISPDGDRGRHSGCAPGGAGRRSAARATAAAAAAVCRVVVWLSSVGVGIDGNRVVSGDGEASGD